MRLLVVTARYPTPDRPSAGAFVRDRLADPALLVRVVAPRSYRGWRWVRFGRLAWDAVTCRGHFDGVEGHFILPTGPVALLAARLRRVELVAVAHGSDVRAVLAARGPRRWLGLIVLRRAARVVANSNATANDLRRLGIDAPVVTPGVDRGRFRPSPRPPRRSVLYLGGDSRIKGIEVARQLADTLLGPGIEELEPSRLPDVLASHDVVIMPSRAEGFGLVAAEATAAGRWVVASSVGGLTEVIIDGVTGTLVTDGDFERAVRSVPEYDPWEVAAHAERFDMERSRRAMADVWMEVLPRGQGPA
jgi:glycosyltransferase involved in cell wall biosynthesis